MSSPRLLLHSFAAFCLVLLLFLAGAASVGAQIDSSPAVRVPPRVVYEIEPGLEGVLDRLAGFDEAQLLPAMELLGLDDPGPPIRVQVVSEGSTAARRAPSWAVAYAFGSGGFVVLIPSRVPVYPDGDLVGVLRHEILHVLVARAGGRYQVPRWFNEGIAVVAAREWRLGDRGRVVLEAFRRDATSMSDVELGFSGGQHSASRAYAVSAAFVRWLLDTEGQRSVARILDHVAEGETFRTAVRSATGTSLVDLERTFWRDFDFWNRWVPFLTSSGALWLVVSALAVVAFYRRRQRDLELLDQWDEEERLLEESFESYSSTPDASIATTTSASGQSASKPSDEPRGGWVN